MRQKDRRDFFPSVIKCAVIFHNNTFAISAIFRLEDTCSGLDIFTGRSSLLQKLIF